MENCILHEAKLNKLESDMTVIASHLQTLLERDNDFTVKVINSKTEERLASELLGEIYVGLKHTNQKLEQEITELKKETPKSILNNLGSVADNLFKVFTLIALVVTMLKVFNS